MSLDKLKYILYEGKLSFDEEALYKLVDFYRLVIDENNRQNLTSIVEEEDFYIKHFLDSLIIGKYYDMSFVKSLIDIGSGAGFPGVPLAIVYKDIQVVLLEAREKRTRFLNEAIDRLSLENVRVITGRAEDFGQSDLRESFDLAVTRAVSKLSTICEYCLPFVRVGGCFVAYKSEAIDEEISSSERAMEELGGKIREIYRFRLANTNALRTLVDIEKVRYTSDKYPRRNGVPEKKPL